MKLISWNLNGIRAVAKKGLFEKLESFEADIICFQETKAQDEQVRETLFGLDGYHVFSNSAVRKGYSGTAILTKKEPLQVRNDMGNPLHDTEGRVIAAEYEHFWLVNVYVPNSGNGLARLDYRVDWDKEFLAFLKNMESHKPVIICGDMNVAHKEIDIARPKSNYNRTAGFTQREIDGMDNFIASGFFDCYRTFYPDEIAYTWWSWRGDAKAKNIGWRIDYFLVSEKLKENVKEAFILPEVEGSDHCPVGIVLDKV